MQRFIFVDLDDTLFQTLRKCPEGDPHLEARAFLANNSANSFASTKQQWLWSWISEGFRVVPVTGRDLGSFERVNLPFAEDIVLNHGAVILTPEREVDPEWMQGMLTALPAYYPNFMQLWQALEQFAVHKPEYKLRLVEDFGQLWYGVIKHQQASEASLQQLLIEHILPHPSVQDGSLYWHLNGNNLAVLPKIINKESAVAYLLARYQREYGPVLSFGAGDSLSDAPFLALCDYAILPKGTQLHTQTFCKRSDQQVSG